MCIAGGGMPHRRGKPGGLAAKRARRSDRLSADTPISAYMRLSRSSGETAGESCVERLADSVTRQTGVKDAPVRPACRRVQTQEIGARFEAGLATRKQAFAFTPRQRGELDPPSAIVLAKAADRNLAIETSLYGSTVSIGPLDQLMQCIRRTKIAGPGPCEHKPIVENNQDRVARGALSERSTLTAVQA